MPIQLPSLPLLCAVTYLAGYSKAKTGDLPCDEGNASR